MILTQRDREILFDIQAHGIHGTRGIASSHFPGVALTTVLRRLRVLERKRYIQRIPGLEGGSFGWALTRESAEKLGFDAAKVHFPRFTLEHDVKLAALRILLEDCGIARSWRPEHEIRARIARKYGRHGNSDRTIPDGLMGVEIDGLKETVAIELELSPKNQTRYRRIIGDYRFKQNLWGFWYVVSKASLGRQLKKACFDSMHLSKQPYFLWSVLDDVMSDPLNAIVSGFKESWRLGDLWTPSPGIMATAPAHTPAQEVSRLEDESGRLENGLSGLIETKTHPPKAV